MSPSAAASNAASFASRMSVSYAAIAVSLSRYCAASNSGSSVILMRLVILILLSIIQQCDQHLGPLNVVFLRTFRAASKQHDQLLPALCKVYAPASAKVYAQFKHAFAD